MRNFEYTAGSLALNFVDTVSDRSGNPTDLISDAVDFIRWARRGHNAFANLNISDAVDVDAVKHLRETIYRSLKASISRRHPCPEDIESINSTAVLSDFRPALKNGDIIYWADDSFNAVLSMIAADAVLCLSNESLSKLRQCPECKMIFRDNSRPQKRIWCSSSSGCGNRAKVRRHRAKKDK